MMFRGEIWLTNLEPTIGAELRKIRPVVIIADSGGQKYLEMRRRLVTYFDLKSCSTARKVQNLVMLVVFDIKQNFFDEIVNSGKIMASENAGLYNDNPSEKDVSVKLARMY